jgi:DeoR family fructose operon transcriptional repressor
MLPKERKQQIVNLVNDRSGCSVDELADEIGVSETTIRRDLQDLTSQNLIERTHGGAVPTVNRGKPYDNRKIYHLDQKAAIGERAVDEIHQEQIVIFDSGSTPIEVAKRVPSDRSFVPVTPMPSIARELAEKEFEVHLTGGIYRSGNHSTVGPWTEKYVQQLTVDLVILGTDGIDETGLTARNVQQSRLKELMIENAERVVLVADHSKFNDSHAFWFADHDAIDLFITDDSIPDPIREAFGSAGVELVANVYS